MTKTISRSELVSRRGELLAELFLQELQPEFIARALANFGYDFFVGFRNPRGGNNVIAIEIKATENVLNGSFSVTKKLYGRWANSNIPVLLLVVNVKENRLFYHWPSSEVASGSQAKVSMSIRLTEIDDAKKAELKDRLTA
jgi:hypothetical protein